MQSRTIVVSFLFILFLLPATQAIAGGETASKDAFEFSPTRATLHLQLVYGDLAIGETLGFGASLENRSDARPTPHDPWFAFDKVQHFSFSFFITVGSQYALVNKLNMRERPALPISMLTSGSVGLAKELYDRYYGPRRFFSQRDMVANAAGILLAAGFILL